MNTVPTTPSISPLRIALVLGSIRADRFAPTLLPWISQHVTRIGDRAHLELIDLADVDLPDDALLAPGGGPQTPVTEAISAADGFIIVTPEYNHGIPAALKRVVDWHLQGWMFKPAGIVSYGSQTGGALAAEQLRGNLAELHVVTPRTTVPVISPWESTGEAGFRASAALDRRLESMLTELTWWGEVLRDARRDRPFTR